MWNVKFFERGHMKNPLLALKCIWLCNLESLRVQKIWIQWLLVLYGSLGSCWVIFFNSSSFFLFVLCFFMTCVKSFRNPSTSFSQFDRWNDPTLLSNSCRFMSKSGQAVHEFSTCVSEYSDIENWGELC